MISLSLSVRLVLSVVAFHFRVEPDGRYVIRFLSLPLLKRREIASSEIECVHRCIEDG